MIDKESQSWKEYTPEQRKMREAAELIVSNMTRDDQMYYCYTVIAGASDTRFRYYCTHVIFDDDNLNINEFDVDWILTGQCGICETDKNSPDNGFTNHRHGIDLAFLMFVVILNQLHLKDILKLYFAVNDGLLSHPEDYLTLEYIRDHYKDAHRVSKEAEELIKEGYTVKKIIKEMAKEVEDICKHDGFNDRGLIDLTAYTD